MICYVCIIFRDPFYVHDGWSNLNYILASKMQCRCCINQNIAMSVLSYCRLYVTYKVNIQKQMMWSKITFGHFLWHHNTGLILTGCILDEASWADELWQMMSLVHWGLLTRHPLICYSRLTPHRFTRTQTERQPHSGGLVEIICIKGKQCPELNILHHPFQLKILELSSDRTLSLRERNLQDRYAQLLQHNRGSADEQISIRGPSYLQHELLYDRYSHRWDYVKRANCRNGWNDPLRNRLKPNQTSRTLGTCLGERATRGCQNEPELDLTDDLCNNYSSSHTRYVAGCVFCGFYM